MHPLANDPLKCLDILFQGFAPKTIFLSFQRFLMEHHICSEILYICLAIYWKLNLPGYNIRPTPNSFSLRSTLTGSDFTPVRQVLIGSTNRTCSPACLALLNLNDCWKLSCCGKNHEQGSPEETGITCVHWKLGVQSIASISIYRKCEQGSAKCPKIPSRKYACHCLW